MAIGIIETYHVNGIKSTSSGLKIECSMTQQNMKDALRSFLRSVPDATFYTWLQELTPNWLKEDDEELSFHDNNPRKSGMTLIANERLRQMFEEGWTPEHDDKHTHMELAKAAENYVRFAHEYNIARDYQRQNGHTPGGWPWHFTWWKPSPDNTRKSKIRDLQKAGALIAAEIDRLIREEDKKKEADE